MEKAKTTFFRNDDVGIFSFEPVSSELISLTQVFVEQGIPIGHGVVPDAVSKETVKWLLEMKSRYPHLIGIDQHGYAHTEHDRGEFGGKRTYAEQQKDILAGMQLMEQHFGSFFSHCFTVPWIKYNRQTKRICDELGYKIFSGGVSPKFHARIFNVLGRSLNLAILGNKEVSYHRRNHFGQSGFSIAEVSVSIDVTGNYQEKVLKTNELILDRYEKCRRHFTVVGFMLHHWVFDGQEKLDQMRRLLTELKKDPGISFQLLSNIPDGINQKLAYKPE